VEGSHPAGECDRRKVTMMMMILMMDDIDDIDDG
jgi:hypothetical protein